jgi:hypothetical protein
MSACDSLDGERQAQHAHERRSCQRQPPRHEPRVVQQLPDESVTQKRACGYGGRGRRRRERAVAQLEAEMLNAAARAAHSSDCLKSGRVGGAFTDQVRHGCACARKSEGNAPRPPHGIRATRKAARNNTARAGWPGAHLALQPTGNTHYGRQQRGPQARAPHVPPRRAARARTAHTPGAHPNANPNPKGTQRLSHPPTADRTDRRAGACSHTLASFSRGACQRRERATRRGGHTGPGGHSGACVRRRRALRPMPERASGCGPVGAGAT